MSNLIEATVQSLNQLNEGQPERFTGPAMRALAKASTSTHGSQHFHKWMGVYHAAASNVAHESGDGEGAKLHSTAYLHHAKHVEDKDWHKGESKEWLGR